MKSTWANNNGKRVMAKALKANAPKDSEFINGKYAEKGNIKTYANKTQCQNKINELRAKGIECDMSMKWPFLILQ